MIARIKEYFASRKRRAELLRQEQELVWEARELYLALGGGLEAPSFEAMRFRLLQRIVASLRQQKARLDQAKAAVAMAALINNPATPLPSREQAGLN